MSSLTAAAWKCDVCGHEWLKGDVMPTHCASSKCRSRRWNEAGDESEVVREVILDREDDSDAYTVTFLLGEQVQGVIDYPHQRHWPRMQDEIDGWRKFGIVPAEDKAC